MLLAILVPTLASLGCSEAEGLAPQTQNYTVSLALTNPDPRFQLVEIQFAQLSVRPADPEANASLTAAGLALLRTSLLLSSLDTEARSSVALTNGAYPILEIILNRLALRDTTPEPNPSNCIEAINNWLYTSNVVITPDDLGFIETVFVENGGANNIHIAVDSSAFVIAFTESWACSPCSSGWCLGPFDDEAFEARAPEYLTFE